MRQVILSANGEIYNYKEVLENGDVDYDVSETLVRRMFLKGEKLKLTRHLDTRHQSVAINSTLAPTAREVVCDKDYDLFPFSEACMISA